MLPKRPLFVPGRRIEQIGKLAEQPFFSRRTPSGGTASSSNADAPPQRRPLLSRVAENAGALFSATLSAILVVALAALVFAFVRELRRDSVLLETFTASKDLVERGYTSTTITEKLLDEIRAIDKGSPSVKTRRPLEYGEALPDIQIARGGLSMKSIVRYARQLFDLPDASISGEIVRRGDALRMTIRTRDRHGTEVVEVTRNDDDVERLLRDAGRAIFRTTDPYILASYLYSREADAGSEAYPETMAAIDYVLSHPPDSDDPWALMLRGNMRFDQGRYENAIVDYRAALERDPIRARGNLALALMAIGRRDEALAYVRQMLARPDTSPGNRNDFGWVLLRDGDAVGAREIARQLLAGQPARGIDFRAFELLAVSLNQSYRQLQALDAIAKYEQIRGTDANSLGQRAYIYAMLGRPESAIDAALRLYAMQPDSSWALQARGYAYAAAGRYDEAAADFARVIDKSRPDNQCSLAQLGDIRLAQGNPDAAIAVYRRHEEAAPRYGYICAGQAAFGWARALDASGKPDGALAKFAAAAKRDPDDVALWRAWAAVLEKQGKKDEAAAKLDEARKAEARLAIPVKVD